MDINVLLAQAVKKYEPDGLLRIELTYDGRLWGINTEWSVDGSRRKMKKKSLVALDQKGLHFGIEEVRKVLRKEVRAKQRAEEEKLVIC